MRHCHVLRNREWNDGSTREARHNRHRALTTAVEVYGEGVTSPDTIDHLAESH